MGKPTRFFDGHIAPPDPRDLHIGSSGATWPTVPPYRWLLGSENPTAELYFLYNTGLLFELDQPASEPGYARWDGPIGMAPVTWARTERFHAPADTDLTILIRLDVIGCPERLEIDLTFPIGPANVDYHVGDWSLISPCVGSTGDTCRLMQVEYNETVPPDGWPPTVPDP